MRHGFTGRCGLWKTWGDPPLLENQQVTLFFSGYRSRHTRCSLRKSCEPPKGPVNLLLQQGKKWV